MLFLLAFLALNDDPPSWEKLEAVHLKNIRQVTSDFVRAGEGYFSPDSRQIIFQAEERSTGNPFYQIFVMDLATGQYRRVSPGIGRTTCSYFRPDGKKIIFASSHLDPDPQKQYAAEQAQRAEEKRLNKRRRYQWDFDPHLDIFEANPDGSGLVRLTDTPGYDAEGSYSPDGKQIVFCSQRNGNLELYIMDADGKNVRQLTHAPGCYNGGPFFSPDGKRVIFRSDRKKKDHLQLYIINSDGSGERALTDDLNWVYWAPYWYKDSEHIVFTGADHSNPAARPNYDVWWMSVDQNSKSTSIEKTKAFPLLAPSLVRSISMLSGVSSPILYPFCTVDEKPKLKPKMVRITYNPGQDVLPVLNADGTKLMWTSTRHGGPPQLFIADFIPPKDD